MSFDRWLLSFVTILLPVQLSVRCKYMRTSKLVDEYVIYNWNIANINKWVEKAGIQKKITFHCARHTFATLLMTKGNDLFTTSRLLGHKDVKTTQIYAKLVDEKRREAVSKLPSFTI